MPLIIIMYQSLILFGFSIASIYFTINNMKKQQSQTSFIYKWKIAQTLLTCGIFLPFIEESVFRSTLKNALVGYPYGDYINSVLFGLMHLTNYYVNPNIFQITVQFLMTTYLGYLCVLQDSFLYAYLLHVGYNMFVLCISYLIFNLFVYEEKEQPKCNFNFIDLMPSFRVNKLTMDDMQIKGNQTIRIKKTNVKPDMIERWKLLDNSTQKKICPSDNLIVNSIQEICPSGNLIVN
jgi:hypothetical protein